MLTAILMELEYNDIPTFVMYDMVYDLMSKAERDKIKDEDFGIPEEKKYPLNTKKRVRAAISYFHKAKNKYKPELARRIIKAAKKFKVDLDKDSPVYRWAKK